MNLVRGIAEWLAGRGFVRLWNGVKKGQMGSLTTGKEMKKPTAVGDALSRRLKILEDAIAEIDKRIAARNKLTKHFKGQIEGEIGECEYLLGKLPAPWREGFIPKMEFIRISLHQTHSEKKVRRKFGNILASGIENSVDLRKVGANQER